MLLLYLIVFLVTIILVVAQLPSPCPEVFSYEPRDDTNDRWYGQIKYTGNKNFSRIWLHITLDRAADILGNWFGHVSTCDNTVFVIRKPQYTLQAQHPFSLRFFVKFNLGKPIPSVRIIKFNGNVICTSENKPNINIITNSEYLESKEVTKPKKINTTNSTFINAESLNTFSQSDVDVTSFQCGVIAPFATPLISQGQETYPGAVKFDTTCNSIVDKIYCFNHNEQLFKGQWPWHAALYHFEGVQISYECGATLITTRHVVTAAHCVTISHTKMPMKTRNILISLGKYNLNTFEEGLQNKGISNIYVHPDYDGLRLYNDIAVLKLSNSVEITNYVRPCCLWEENPDLNNIVGNKGIVVGWGDNGKISYKLRQTAMPVVSRDECLFSKREYREFLSRNNFCAGNRNGTTACRGDSGSAMVFPKTESNGQTVWQIRGIVSLSLIPKIQGTCEMSNYNIFTDVAKFNEWIKQVILD